MTEYKNVMLISPDEIKGSTFVNNNVDDNILGGAIREAQRNHLAEITGERLLEKIQELVFNDIKEEHPSIEDAEYAAYKTLLDDYISPYLEAKSQTLLTVPLTFKLRNMGVTSDSDTNVSPLGMNDVKAMAGWLETQAAHRATELSAFLKENKASFPELKRCACGDDDGMIGLKFINVGLNLKVRR